MSAAFMTTESTGLPSVRAGEGREGMEVPWRDERRFITTFIH